MAWRFHPVLHVAHLVEELVGNELDRLGLQPRQARILVAIGQSGPVSQAALARAFAVSRPSMTVMIERMLRDGLVEHRQQATRRHPFITLTEYGAQRVPEIELAWSRVDTILRERLGAKLLQDLSEAALQARNALGGRAPHELLPKGDRP